MPFGMGPLGWAYVYPWVYPYCGYPYYDYPYGPWIPYAPWGVSREDEIAMLEDQARVLEGELDSVRKRLEERRTS